MLIRDADDQIQGVNCITIFYYTECITNFWLINRLKVK